MQIWARGHSECVYDITSFYQISLGFIILTLVDARMYIQMAVRSLRVFAPYAKQDNSEGQHTVPKHYL